MSKLVTVLVLRAIALAALVFPINMRSFVVNYDDATAAGSHAVIEHVQARVKRQFDVELHPEVGSSRNGKPRLTSVRNGSPNPAFARHCRPQRVTCPRGTVAASQQSPITLQESRRSVGEIMPPCAHQRT